MSIAIQRIKRAIQDMPTGGMQTGKKQIKLEYSDAQRAITEIEALQAELDALAAQVEKLKPLARRCLWGAINWNDHNFGPLHKYCRESAAEAGVHTIDQANTLLEEAPAKALAEIRAEAGRAGFDDGYSKCWREVYGTKPNADSLEEYADAYTEKIRQGGTK